MSWNAGTTVVLAGVWSEQYARASSDEALAKSIASVAATMDQNTAAIITEQMARTTADESLANQIISISATVDANGALIKAEQTARADADSALAQNITTVQAAVNIAQQGVTQNAAAIQAEQTARADADSALATQITTVQASATAANTAASTAQTAANSAAQAAADAAGLAGTKGKVLIQSTAPAAADRLAQNLWIDTTGNANTPKRWSGSAWVAVTDKAATDAASAAAAAQAAANAAQQGVTQNAAAIQTEQTARANADSALATQITTVQASATAANTAASNAQSAANSAAQAAADAAGLAGTKGKVLIQSTAPAAADRLAQNLWIDTTGNANTPKRWSGSAWVAVTDKAATDAASAAAAAQAAANAAQQGVTQNAAAIQTEQTARANADSALATQITTVQATANNASAAVQQTSTALAELDGKLQAMYSVKVGVTADGKYYGAGMAIGVENTPAGMQSQVLFTADRFAIVNQITGTSTITTPFTVQGGQVFINNAVIGDGTISNAKIGSYIQSTNYVANSIGWKLDKNGLFEINGYQAGQGRMRITNERIDVYDAAGTLKIRLGKLI
ncbi:DUF1983 domain-containing protein [Shewanella sp. SM95]|uniref:DUF1983 domain-containing protein n=1 Tax=Shewanella sp. SM95 TaxID=2912812 RepID=UPI0021D8EE5D|nr:DUF1983 domain-containing protein [Shewanella sp. SM95]MCU7997858.1 DUF1983 domain-containing protein [Shewanella sp. SM95]